MVATEEHERTRHQAHSDAEKARESSHVHHQELARMQKTATNALKDAEGRQQRQTTKAKRKKRAKSFGV
jgi:hypothetical protein